MNEVVAWLRGVCGEFIALEPALETVFGDGRTAGRTGDTSALHSGI